MAELLTFAEEVAARNKRDRWRTEHELAANTIELLSMIRNEQLLAAGVKQHKLPKLIRIPRPGKRNPNAPKGVSWRDLIRRMSKAR